MDNRKRVIIAILCGLLAALSLAGYLHYREQKLLELSTAVPIVVAARDIERNARLDETVLGIRRIPRKYLQPHAVSAGEINSILGQVASSPIIEGEQILTTKLLRFGRSTGLALKVNPGARAVSILVSDVTGVGGLIKPNDRVDVLSTFDFGDEAKSKEYTFTLFQNLSVLAVSDEMGEGYSSLVRGQNEKDAAAQIARKVGRETFVVTLAVTPEQAQNLALAQETGTLSLALRGLGESDNIVDLPPATPADLTGIKSLMKQNEKPIYQQYKGGRR